MIYTEADTLDRFPNFKAKVESILNASRDSAMKPASVQRFANRRRYEQSSNEDTLLVNLIPLIIKDHFTQRSERAFSDVQQKGEDRNEAGVELKEWFDEGLTYKYNTEFRRCQLPNSYCTDDEPFDPELVKALSKEDGMLNPKPDYTFGLRTDKFDSFRPADVILGSEIFTLLEIAPRMNHPFFIIEGKSNKGVIGDAEIQVRRGGAALVNAGRKLLGFIRTRDSLLKEGPDTETFIFSATITPQNMDIYVHWAEVVVSTSTEVPQPSQPGNATPLGGQSSAEVQASSTARSHPPKSPHVVFHMTYLKSYNLRDSEALPILREVLHNILEYGCTDRAAQLLELRKGLYTYQRSETSRLTKEACESDRKSNKRQRLNS